MRLLNLHLTSKEKKKKGKETIATYQISICDRHDFIEIMDMLDKRLNDKGKNWRHVFKALLVLDYCLHVGSENVVLYAKENIYVIRTLKEFQHIDDTGKDVGFNGNYQLTL
jgi:hypothetical protein